MKIAYFELGVADFYEDYSINTKGYGGGLCFAKYAKQSFNNENDTFILFGDPHGQNHFERITKEFKYDS